MTSRAANYGRLVNTMRKLTPGTFSGESRVATPFTCRDTLIAARDETAPAVCFTAELSGWETGESGPTYAQWTVTDPGCGVVPNEDAGEFFTAELPEGCYEITATLDGVDLGDITIEVSQGDDIWGTTSPGDPCTSVLTVEVPEVCGQVVVYSAGINTPTSGTLTICCGAVCPTCPEYPTAYDTVTGDYVNAAVVALPSGSDGDTLVFIYYGNAAMSTFAGWTLGPSQTLSPPGHGRYRVWYKTRAGGETTATLTTIAGSAGYAYSITNIVGGGFAPTSAEAQATNTVTVLDPWAFSGTWTTDCPKFALGLLHAGDSISFSGTFIEDSQAATSGVIDGHYDVARTYVSDLASGSHSMDAGGIGYEGWTQGGWATWVAVFFS